jgi:hypothetical protein
MTGITTQKKCINYTRQENKLSLKKIYIQRVHALEQLIIPSFQPKHLTEETT